MSTSTSSVVGNVWRLRAVAIVSGLTIFRLFSLHLRTILALWLHLYLSNLREAAYLCGDYLTRFAASLFQTLSS
jgi:hypothetical protein